MGVIPALPKHLHKTGRKRFSNMAVIPAIRKRLYNFEGFKSCSYPSKLQQYGNVLIKVSNKVFKNNKLKDSNVAVIPCSKTETLILKDWNLAAIPASPKGFV